MSLINPLGLDATALLVWGAVAHAIADWPLQNDWMAAHKAARRERHTKATESVQAEAAARAYARGHTFSVEAYTTSWWDRHPAAYAHAGVHLELLLPVFGLAAVAIALAHLVIDTRKPVVWLSRLVGQTQPRGDAYISADAMATGGVHGDRPYRMDFDAANIKVAVYDDKEYANQSEVERRLDRLEADLREWTAPAYDIGTEVRFWTDQAWHLATLAVAALIVAAIT